MTPLKSGGSGRLAVLKSHLCSFCGAGLQPKDIDIIVTTCSIFCPTPSITSMLVNHFGMRTDVQSYHLGGMGCSNGVVAVNLINDLLKVC
jgi:3-ketoacyl-CoA synthase